MRVFILVLSLQIWHGVWYQTYGLTTKFTRFWSIGERHISIAWALQGGSLEEVGNTKHWDVVNCVGVGGVGGLARRVVYNHISSISEHIATCVQCNGWITQWQYYWESIYFAWHFTIWYVSVWQISSDAQRRNSKSLRTFNSNNHFCLRSPGRQYLMAEYTVYRGYQWPHPSPEESFSLLQRIMHDEFHTDIRLHTWRVER